MSDNFKLLREAWKVWRKPEPGGIDGFTATDKLVLVRVADLAGSSGLCYASQKTIARDCCLSDRSVRDSLAKILAAGLVKVERQATFRSPAVYRVTLSRAEHPSTPEAPSGLEPESGETGTTFPSPPEPRSTQGGTSFRQSQYEPNSKPNLNPSLAPVDSTLDLKLDPVPVANGHRKPSRKQNADEAAFDAFYAAYPKHKKREDARKAWAQITPDEAAAIMEALKWQKTQPDWLKDRGQFVPYPASYLRGRQWEDERPGGSDDQKYEKGF